jgi:hypothetical protein
LPNALPSRCTPRVSAHCRNQPQQLCFSTGHIAYAYALCLQPSRVCSTKTGVDTHGLLIFLYKLFVNHFYRMFSKLRFVSTPTTVRRRESIPPSAGVYPVGAARCPALDRGDDVAHHGDIAAQRQQHGKHVPKCNVRHRRAVSEAIMLINPGNTRIFPPVTRKLLLTWPA